MPKHANFEYLAECLSFILGNFLVCFRLRCCCTLGELRQKCSNKHELQFLFCLFGLRLYVPVNNFSVMLGRSHASWVLPVLFGEVNVSCSRIQHGDLSEDRTPDLSLRSPTLYHQATTPPMNYSYPTTMYKSIFT